MSAPDDKSDNKSDNIIAGVEAQVKIFAKLLQRITTLIDYENGILLQDDKRMILRNKEHQELRERLFQRFEHFATALSYCAKNGMIKDREIVKDFIPILAAFQRSMLINATLLEIYINTSNQMIEGIFKKLEIENQKFEEGACH